MLSGVTRANSASHAASDRAHSARSPVRACPFASSSCASASSAGTPAAHAGMPGGAGELHGAVRAAEVDRPVRAGGEHLARERAVPGRRGELQRPGEVVLGPLASVVVGRPRGQGGELRRRAEQEPPVSLGVVPRRSIGVTAVSR